MYVVVVADWLLWPGTALGLGGYGSVTLHVVAIVALFLLTQWAVVDRLPGRAGTRRRVRA